MPKNPLILGGRNFYLNGFETEKNITITDISGKKKNIAYYFLFLEIALMRKMHLLHDQMDKTKLIVTEDEWMPFRKNNFDAAISCLNSHWIENLKGKSLSMDALILLLFRLWTSSALYPSKGFSFLRGDDRWKFPL